MTKHTPGPWSIAEGRKLQQAIIMTGGIPIIAMSQKWDEDCALFNLPDNPSFGDKDVTLANAKLIAAAPELLEACKMIMEAEAMQHGDRTGGTMARISLAINAARTAIAKAEGAE